MSRALHANFSSYDLVSGGWSEVRSEGYVSRNTLTRERKRKKVEKRYQRGNIGCRNRIFTEPFLKEFVQVKRGNKNYILLNNKIILAIFSKIQFTYIVAGFISIRKCLFTDTHCNKCRREGTRSEGGCTSCRKKKRERRRTKNEVERARAHSDTIKKKEHEERRQIIQREV